MREAAASMRHEFIGLYGMVERNWYLIKRYAWWEIAFFFWTAHDATILLCTHDLAEAEALADRVGILDRGRLLCLEPVEEVKARFGVETLEEAFFAATGRSFEEETEEDKDREVMA